MPRQEIPLNQRRTNPGQVRMVDNRDDRLEIATLLKHLPPGRRYDFLGWVCAQAWLPNSSVHPQPASSMRRLVDEARHCDESDERLTMEILLDIAFMGCEYALDLSAVLAELVTWVRRPKDSPGSARS